MHVLLAYQNHLHYYLMYLKQLMLFKQLTTNQNIKRDRIFKNLPNQIECIGYEMLERKS